MALSLVISIPLGDGAVASEAGEVVALIASDLADESVRLVAGEVFTYTPRVGPGIIATVSVVDDGAADHLSAPAAR